VICHSWETAKPAVVLGRLNLRRFLPRLVMKEGWECKFGKKCKRNFLHSHPSARAAAFARKRGPNMGAKEGRIWREMWNVNFACRSTCLHWLEPD